MIHTLREKWVRTYGEIGSTQKSRAIITAIYRLCGGAPMIDLGCGAADITKYLKGEWVDIEPVEESPERVIKADIRELSDIFRGDWQFNLAVLTDVIEHFSKAEGLKLIADASNIAKTIVILTPTGEFCVSEDKGPHSHKSGWTPEELWLAGWSIWEWPVFHCFSSWAQKKDAIEDVRGAFFAWKSRENTPTSIEVLRESCL